jgi:plasmid stability protein
MRRPTADILVRGLEKAMVERLKRRAKRHGRSLQGELKEILIEKAVLEDVEAALQTLAAHRASFGRTFDDNTQIIREARDE